LVRRMTKHFGCATEFTLHLLGGKWKTIILCYLKEGAWRYGELRSFMPKLSDKVLTERLKELQGSGLIERSGPGAANAVRYRLTTRGEALRTVLSAIYQWGEKNATAYNVEVDDPLRGRKRKSG